MKILSNLWKINENNQKKEEKGKAAEERQGLVERLGQRRCSGYPREGSGELRLGVQSVLKVL